MDDRRKILRAILDNNHSIRGYLGRNGDDPYSVSVEGETDKYWVRFIVAPSLWRGRWEGQYAIQEVLHRGCAHIHNLPVRFGIHTTTKQWVIFGADADLADTPPSTPPSEGGTPTDHE